MRKPVASRLGLLANQGFPDGDSRGLTLVELLAASLAGALILSAATSLILSQLNLSKRTATIARLRQNWSNSTSFLVSEIAFSEKIFNSASSVTISSSCGISSTQFRLGLTLRPNLPPVIYGVKTSPSMLNPDNALWRCGPKINDDGSYSSTLEAGIIADELDGAATGGGFAVSISGEKQVELSLSIKGNSTNFFKLSTTGVSRINPDFLTPREVSLCVAANNIADIVGNTSPQTGSLSLPGLACGGGGGDNLTGSSGDDVLEAGDNGAATLNGGSGDDFIRGTNNNDALTGGPGDDTLVGRLGNDTLSDTSATGTNQLSPGPGNDTINGGAGLDILYLTREINNYTLSSTCNKTSCTITSTGSGSDGTKSTTGIDVIIFRDARKDL